MILSSQSKGLPNGRVNAMDVYCPKCAEPVEMDYFHDIADEQHTTYAAVARNFRVIGCAAIGE